MSFGLRTWSDTGIVQMDTDSFTYQILHSQTYKLTAGQVLDVSVPGFDPGTCSAAILPIGELPNPDVGITGAIPYVSVSSGSISIRSKHPSEASQGLSTRLEFRLLVMRYK